MTSDYRLEVGNLIDACVKCHLPDQHWIHEPVTQQRVLPAYYDRTVFGGIGTGAVLMFNMPRHSRRHFAFAAGHLALFLCVGCGGPYYTVEGNLNTKYPVIHDGNEEIKIDLSTGSGDSVADGAVDSEDKFEIEVDGVKIKGSVTALGSIHLSKVVYKGKKLGAGSWNDIQID